MTIKTTGEIAREYLDEAATAALAKFRDAVKPIYGATDRGAPDHIGTALLLDLQEGRFLLTAAHVIDHNRNTSLFLGTSGFAMLQFEALVSAAPDDNRAGDHADFAIARLDDEFLAKLSSAKFITEADISRSVAPSDGRTYTCLGYPNSKNKKKTAKRSKRHAEPAVLHKHGKTCHPASAYRQGRIPHPRRLQCQICSG